MEESTEQREIREKRLEQIKPWQFKKGVSGNPTGRPKGPSMKEWSRSYLASLTDEQRIEFLEGLDKNDIWKMGEGGPENKTDITTNGKDLKFEVVNYGDNNNPPPISA